MIGCCWSNVDRSLHQLTNFILISCLAASRFLRSGGGVEAQHFCLFWRQWTPVDGRAISITAFPIGLRYECRGCGVSMIQVQPGTCRGETFVGTRSLYIGCCYVYLPDATWDLGWVAAGTDTLCMELQTDRIDGYQDLIRMRYN